MITAARQARLEVIKSALDRPCTAAAIVKRTRLGRTTVWRWLQRLHDAEAIHVFDWAPELGGPVPIYAFGPGVDAECTIVPMTAQQRTARCRRRQRQSEAVHARINAATRSRALEAAARADYRMDPLMGALFAPLMHRNT
jgi:hypothetical protein